MTEDIKNLIEKIQQEGIKAAEEKAGEIENQAKRRAEEIIKAAEKEAKKLIENAKNEIEKMEKSSKASLEQAGRDLLISLRQELDAMLERVIASEVRQEFKPDELNKIIAGLIKEMSGTREGNIVVSLKEDDLRKLERDFLQKLADEVKKGITLKSVGEISGGFIISYDDGKSHFDFSDKGIAEYLSLHLKPALAEMLKKAAEDNKLK